MNSSLHNTTLTAHINTSKRYTTNIPYNHKLRVALQCGGEVIRSWILGELWNLIGREQHYVPVVVYTTVKSPLMENIGHGWKNDMDVNVADTF